MEFDELSNKVIAKIKVVLLMNFNEKILKNGIKRFVL